MGVFGHSRVEIDHFTYFWPFQRIFCETTCDHSFVSNEQYLKIVRICGKPFKNLLIFFVGLKSGLVQPPSPLCSDWLRFQHFENFWVNRRFWPTVNHGPWCLVHSQFSLFLWHFGTTCLMTIEKSVDW